jgi:hypothetical protein
MRKLVAVLVGAGTTIAALAMTASPAVASQSLVLYAKACSICPGEGYVQYNADPTPQIPGDNMRVCDVMSDGWYVQGWMLDLGGRVLRTGNTYGHNAPYCGPWMGGDLQEDQRLTMVVCLVKGTETKDCRSDYAWA